MSNLGQGAVPKWAVAQIYSKRARLIRDEIHARDRGTFTPTFIKRWLVDGDPKSKEADLLPTYVFFEVKDEAWGPIGQIEGVLRVMNDGKPVAACDMSRLEWGQLNKVWDDKAPLEKVNSEPQRKYRRPRRSKRIERRAARAAQWRAA